MFYIKSRSSNFYVKLCNGIAKYKILLSVKLWWWYSNNKPKLNDLPVIFKKNSTIQSFTTNAILCENVHVAEVNTPLKVFCVNRYMPWFTECTQLQYLRLDLCKDGLTMKSLLAHAIDHLKQLDVHIENVDAYTTLCDHLKRNNSTLKILILSDSRNERCALQLQHMLSENITLLGFKVHHLHPNHSKYITAGLNSNKTLESLCLGVNGKFVKGHFTFNGLSQLQTNLKYLEFTLHVKESNFLKIFQTI